MSSVKPPLGLLPERTWKEQRLTDINEAIKRYADANLPISLEWLKQRDILIQDIFYSKINGACETCISKCENCKN